MGPKEAKLERISVPDKQRGATGRGGEGAMRTPARSIAEILESLFIVVSINNHGSGIRHERLRLRVLVPELYSCAHVIHNYRHDSSKPLVTSDTTISYL